MSTPASRTRDADGLRADAIASTTTDLTGDRKPDLVVTERNALAGVGVSKWQVFPNTGSGFGVPVGSALPGVGAEATRTPFAQLADNESIIGMLDANNYSVIAYATTDLLADGKVDLVITDRTRRLASGRDAGRSSQARAIAAEQACGLHELRACRAKRSSSGIPFTRC